VHRLLLFLPMLPLLASIPASAQVVEYSAVGSMISFPELNEGPFVEGDEVVVTASIDTSAADLNPLGETGLYFDALITTHVTFPSLGLSFTFDGGSVQGESTVGTNDDVPVNPPGLFVDNLDIVSTVPNGVSLIEGTAPIGIQIRFDKFETDPARPDMLSSGARPATLDGNVDRFATVFCLDANCADLVQATFLYLPEPSGALGLASALGPLAALYRRRRPRRAGPARHPWAAHTHAFCWAALRARLRDRRQRTSV